MLKYSKSVGLRLSTCASLEEESSVIFYRGMHMVCNLPTLSHGMKARRICRVPEWGLANLATSSCINDR